MFETLRKVIADYNQINSNNTNKEKLRTKEIVLVVLTKGGKTWKRS
jgi:hypothetical protein